MNWQAKPIQHKNEQRIAVYFDNTPTLNARIKKLPDAKWSNSLKAWHVPDNAENRKRFKITQCCFMIKFIYDKNLSKSKMMKYPS